MPGSSEPTKSSGAPKPRYWLRYGIRSIPLGVGSFVLGRNAACSVTFNDPLVSRRHAELSIDDDGATIVDLDSANGVFVNGIRINAPTRLADGDRLLIGSLELTLVNTNDSWRPRDSVETRQDVRPIARDHEPLPDELRALVPDLDESLEEGDDENPASSDHTRRADVFDVLGGVASKLLAKNQGVEAERVLSPHLQGALSIARQDSTRLPAEVAHKAAQQALKLAAATRKGEWADFVLELYTVIGRPMSTEIVDELYALMRVVSLNLSGLRRYLERLRDPAIELGPNERFVLRRLEGLEQLVATR